MTFRVGLTGGIGSGKSAAAAHFAQLGADVIDTDAIAHALTAPGGAGMPPIVARFGPAMAAADGSLDRSQMRELAFSDPEARHALEGILHPMIRTEVDRQIAGCRALYVVVVVPLLVESGGYRDRVERVVVVDCLPETQIARVSRRNGLDRTEVERILAAQASRAARLAVADDVIDNDGPLDRLAPQVERLHRRYIAAAGLLDRAL